MPINDITKTGGRDLQGIRNPDIYNNTSVEDNIAAIDQRSTNISRGGLGYTDVAAPGWDKPVPMPELGDYGTSKYDTGLITNPQDNWDVTDRRAANQSAWAKWGAAIPLAVTTAGTTFAGSTIGFAYGLGQSIASGEGNKIWNNEFTAAMDTVNKAVSEAIPIYQSKEEQLNPISNMGAGMLASNMGQLVGFMAGAAYSGATYMKALQSLGKGLDTIRAGKGAFKAISSLAKSSKNNMATQSLASILGSNGEATIEAYGNSQDWAEYKKVQLMDQYNMNGPQFIQEATNTALQEVNPAEYSSQESYEQAIRMRSAQIADEGYNKKIEEIDNASIKMGNVLWAENMALLSFTNFKALGRVYSGGYRANKTLSNFVKRTTNEAGETVLKASTKGMAKNLATSVGRAMYEGGEEMMQASFSRGAGYWVEGDIYEPLREKRDTNGEAETFNLVTGLAEGIKDQMADPNNWVEFIMGTVAGMLPLPMPHRNSKGKIVPFKAPEMVSSFIENREMNNLAIETVDRINAMRDTPKYQTLMDALIVDTVKENKKKDTIGDEFSYKTEDYAQLVNLVTSLEKVDQVDLFTDKVQSAIDMEVNEENGQVILEGLSKDGAVPEYLQNKTPKEVVVEYKDKAKQVMQDINQIVTNSENIRATYGDQLTPDALTTIVALKSKLDNWNKRYKEIAKNLPSYIHNMEVNSTDVNLSTIIGSLVSNTTPVSFVTEELSPLNDKIKKAVRKASTATGYTGDSADKVSSDLMDMYRLGMSLRNGLNIFNEITSNPTSFNQKVEKEKDRENTKRQKENITILKDKYNEVRTLKDLRALASSTDPQEYADLVEELKKSKDPKFKDLNQKKSLLSRILQSTSKIELPSNLESAVEDIIESIVENTSTNEFLKEGSEVLFEEPINTMLSRLLSTNTFNLTQEELATLPDQIIANIKEALDKKRDSASKIPVINPSSAVVQEDEDDFSITFTNGEIYSPDNSTANEDIKLIESILSPSLNPKSESPTVEPIINNHFVEIDNSIETSDGISAGVSEINFAAFKKTGQIITPVQRDAWNQFNIQNTPSYGRILGSIDENFSRIYNYLVDKGAYKYLNSGQLHTEDSVIAFTDTSFGETLFFGKPLKPLNEIQSISDIQVIAAAPRKYRMGAKILQSKDNNLTIDIKGLTVAQVFNGKYQYGENNPISIADISELFSENATPDWTIGVISNNGQIYSKIPLTEDMIAHDTPFNIGHDGRVMLFVKGPNGKYMPISLNVAKFKGDYSGTMGNKINSAISTIASIVSMDTDLDSLETKGLLNEGLVELSKFLYTGNIIATISTIPGKLGWPTKHLTIFKKNIDGTLSNKQHIPLEASTQDHTRVTSEVLSEGIKNALIELGVGYQTAKNMLRSDKNYENFLINSGILSSNILRVPLIDTNFSLVEKGQTLRTKLITPQPAPANPSTVTQIASSTIASPTTVEIGSPSKVFNSTSFESIMSDLPLSVQDAVKGLDGKSMNTKRQLLIATILLAPSEVIKPLGSLDSVLTTVLKNKLPFLKEVFTIANINRDSLSEENKQLYDKFEASLNRDTLFDEIYMATIDKFTNSKGNTTIDINNSEKSLDITNNLRIFAELTDSIKESLTNIGVTEDEFNSWSADQQDKIIQCNS